MNWIQDCRRPVSSVVESLGWTGRNRHYPCPAKCSDGSARKEDRSVYSTGDGWLCHRCGAKGDAVDFVAYALHGARLSACSPEQRDEVRAWFGVARPVLAPAPKPAPVVDVEGFWRRCERLTALPFLRDRGLDVRLLAAADVARLTPAEPREWPEWWPATRARTWRLVTRGYGADGAVRNLHGRAVVPPPGDAPKTLWAKGVPSAGCLLWNRVPPNEAALMLVAEGMTDWLTLAAWAEGRGVAVYGVTSGSARALSDLDVRCDVVVVTDEDAAGDTYAEQAFAALSHRRCLRARPSRLLHLLAQAAK